MPTTDGAVTGEPESEETQVYGVDALDAGFAVRRDGGRSSIVCGDRGTAESYAALMNEAYRLGYRAGFRKARRAKRSDATD